MGLIVEKVSGRTLNWVCRQLKLLDLKGLYIASDRYGMPWMSGGGCLIARDFLRMGLLLQKGMGVEIEKLDHLLF